MQYRKIIGEMDLDDVRVEIVSYSLGNVGLDGEGLINIANELRAYDDSKKMEKLLFNNQKDIPRKYRNKIFVFPGVIVHKVSRYAKKGIRIIKFDEDDDKWIKAFRYTDYWVWGEKKFVLIREEDENETDDWEIIDKLIIDIKKLKKKVKKLENKK